MSGLHVNWRKSFLYPVNEVPNMEIFKSILGGEVGVLPTTYLGMPLGTKSNFMEIRDGVIEKCEKRLARWKSQYLSLGGRLTLINSVLDALPTYMMSLFPIPPGIINRLDSIRRNFLWQGNKERRGFHLVKWKTVITEKRVGGLGIKNMKNQSKALRMKWLWKYSNDNQNLWGSVIKAKYEESDSWMTKEVTTPYGVSLWKSIRELWNKFKPNTKIKVVDGIKTRFWKDDWHAEGNMETLFPDIHNLVLQQQSTIADLWTPQGWNFVFRRHLNDWEIPRVTEFFRSIDQFSGLEMGRDRLQWLGNSKGVFKVGAVYKKLNHPNLQLLKWPWKHIWKAKIPYKVSCFVWLLAKEAVLTQENLMKRGITLCSRCFFLWENCRNSQSFVYPMRSHWLVVEFVPET